MKIDGLKIKYKNKEVFSSLSLSIEKNEKVALIGASGEGKTSLIKALLSLVEYEGMIENKPTFSVIFQEDRLVNELSARENILLACPNADADLMLGKVGLYEQRNDKVKTFSGGMKRRVAIARALAKEGEMLIADEPFVGLDLATKTAINGLLRQSIDDRGLLLISHDLLPVYALCERIIIIENGQVAIDEKTSDFSIEQAQEYFLKKI